MIPWLNVVLYSKAMAKVVGSRTCRIGLVNQQNIKVAKIKSSTALFFVPNISTFMNSAHFPVLTVFFCVLDRVAIY